MCPDQPQPGFTYPGSFAELVAVPAAGTNLVALPEGVDPVAAASLGCRFATAWRALTAHGEVGAGDVVAVHGCGGVGLSAVMIAAALGADVVALDPSPVARDRAADARRRRGARPGRAADARWRPGCARPPGAGRACPSTRSGCRPRRRPRSAPCDRAAATCRWGCCWASAARPGLPMDVVVGRELSVHGSHGMPAADYPAMLERVADGSLRPGSWWAGWSASRRPGPPWPRSGTPPPTPG